MGINDRDYIRRRPPGGGLQGQRAFTSMRMWSVNTWLIVICVAVFLIDGFVPQPWKAIRISEDVPAHITLSSKPQPQYQEQAGPNEDRLMVFQRPVVDYSVNPPQQIGTVTYQRMPPLRRWFHFSTALTFLRPLLVFEFWRFIGFQFLHAGLVHLLFNMIALYFFGPMVEAYLGRKRYLAFYLLCGICGALMYVLLNVGGFVVDRVFHVNFPLPALLFNSPYTPLIGASAGVFGVLMAGAYMAPRTTVLLFFFLPMQLRTLAYALTALALYSVLFGRHNAGGEAGHLGGAIAGFYFIRHPHHLHDFFDVLGRIDPTSHHYRGKPGQIEVDKVLDKVKSTGLQSLTKKERRILQEASERK